ncbi:MAG: O-antigen ligase family protein, partial [Ferrovibrio sp.]
MAYGNVFAGLMLLWPLLAVLGTQGFAPLAGLTGIAALVLARPRMPPPAYALLGLVFIAWVVISEFWSPAGKALSTGNLLQGDFAIGTQSVIILLAALFAMLTIAAALKSELSAMGRKLLIGAFAVQGGFVLLSALIGDAVIKMIYGPEPQHFINGIQNMGRNVNSFAIVLPILVGILGAKGGRSGLIAAAVLTMMALFAGLATDNSSTVFAVAGMLGGFVMVTFLPQSGLRWLFCGLAAYIAAAPFLMRNFIQSMTGFDHILPDSFRSRFWSWEVVLGRIGEAPFFGHGIGATRTWQETYTEYPAWMAQLPENWSRFQVVPNHPHNMALHIWAETGLVGALLAAFALTVLAFRLPRPAEFKPEMRFAIAGMAGAAVSIFSF